MHRNSPALVRVALMVSFLALALVVPQPRAAHAAGLYASSVSPAISQSLDNPADIAVALDGSIYVADEGNARIVRLDGSGAIVTQFEGADSPEQQLVRPRGIAIGPDTNIYVADFGANRISVFSPSGAFIRSFGANTGVSATFNAPSDVAFDSQGRLHVAEFIGRRVQVLTTAGALLFTYGTSTQLYGPTSLVAYGGNMYIADANESVNTVQVWSEAGVYVRQWGLSISSPYLSRYARLTGIASDGAGRVFIADAGNSPLTEQPRYAIEVCNATVANPPALSTYGGMGSTDGKFGSPEGPRGMALVGSTLYVADGGNNRIGKLNLTSNTLSWLGAYTFNGSAASGSYRSPSAAVETSHGVYVVDAGNNRIQRFNAGGGFVASFGGSQAASPTGIAASPDGTELYVSDLADNRLEVFDAAGSWLRSIGTSGTTAGRFSSPRGIAVLPDGNLLVADSGNNRVQQVTPAGAWVAYYTGLSRPRAVAYDDSLTVYVADTGNSAVKYYTSPGGAAGSFGSMGTLPGRFSEPSGIVCDTATGLVMVSDTNNNRIQSLTSAGVPVSSTGVRGSAPAEFSGPMGISLARDGSLLVADTGNHRMQRLKPDADPPTCTAPSMPTGWVTVPPSFSVTAADSGSGVASIRYQFNSDPERSYYGTVTAPAIEGLGQVAYHAIDRAGNEEVTQYQNYMIDFTAPVTDVFGVPAGYAGAAVNVYLFPADTMSGVDRTEYRIDGGGTQVLPAGHTIVRVEGEGVHSLEYRSFDVAGNAEDWRSVTVPIDLTPPQTTISGVPASWSTSSDVTVTLSATDARSGVSETYYVKNGGTPELYTGPFTVTEEGTTKIGYFSVDKAGNVENESSLTISIDRSKPTVALSGVPAGWTSAAQVNLTVSGADGVSGLGSFGYRINGGAAKTTTGAFAISTEGDNTVEYWSVDVAGNQSVHQTAHVRIDRVDPITTPTAETEWVNHSVLVSLSSADALSGIFGTFCSVGAQPEQLYAGPIVVSAEGQTPVAFHSEDLAGNVESSRVVTVSIDYTPPTGPVSINAGQSVCASRTVAISANVPDAVTMSFDHGAGFSSAVAYAASAKVTVPSDGVYTVKARYYDRAGNTLDASRSVRVDTVAPTVGITGVPAIGTTNGTVNLDFTAADTGSGVESIWYRINGGPESKYTGSVTLSAEATYTVQYRAIDVAGISSASASTTFEIDRTAPKSMLHGVPAAWSGSTVSLTASATDARSGVVSIHYSINGGPALLYSGAFDVLASGANVVSVWATDRAGNVEAQHSETVRVDKVQPVISVGGVPAGWVQAGSGITLSASDSLSGVASIRYSVNGGASTRYINPITIDTEGVNELAYAAIDAAGNVSTTQTAQVRIDQHAPATLATLETNWTNGPVTISLGATDGLSGVAATYFTVDGQGEQLYQDPVRVTTEGETTVWFRSVDSAGNVEAMKSVKTRIDYTPPTGTVTINGGSAYCASREITVAAVVPDAVRMAFDTGAGFSTPVAYAASAVVLVAADGDYTVRARYYDRAGNTLDVQRLVTVDTVKPTAAVSGVADGDLTYQDVLLDFSSNEPAARLYYRIDSGIEQLYTGAVTVSAEGPHVVTYRAVDPVGNSSDPAVVHFTIDRTTPAGTLKIAGGQRYIGYTDGVPLVSAMLNTIQMRIDAGSGFGIWQSYIEYATVNLPGEGVRSVTVEYRSSAGVVSSRTASVTVDMTPPTVSSIRIMPTVMRVGAGGVGSYDLVARWSGVDGGSPPSGIAEYSWLWDGSASYGTKAEASAQGVGVGPHSLAVAARDAVSAFTAPKAFSARVSSGMKPYVAGLRPLARRTFTMKAPAGGSLTGGTIRLRAYTLQPDGSYKPVGSWAGRIVSAQRATAVIATPKLGQGRYRFAFEVWDGAGWRIGQPSDIVSVR